MCAWCAKRCEYKALQGYLAHMTGVTTQSLQSSYTGLNHVPRFWANLAQLTCGFVLQERLGSGAPVLEMLP